MKIGWQAFALLGALSLIWGTSFILIKLGLEGLSPIQVGGLRICAAALVMLPFTIRHIRDISRKNAFYIFLFGLCNAGIPAYLFAMSETHVNSAAAGVLNSLTPFFTLISGYLFFSVELNLRKVMGTVVGFMGALWIILHQNGFANNPLSGDNLIYVIYIVIATALYGFGGNIMKSKLNEVPGKVTSALSYFFHAFPAIIILSFTDLGHRASTSAGKYSLFYVFLLGTFGSAIAIWLYSKLVQRSNALFGSFVTYLVPFVALMWGMIFGEAITAAILVGLLLILAGIFIATPEATNLFIRKSETVKQ